MVPRLDQCGARKPTCMDTQVNMKKVNRECIAGWISSHPELVALGDDVIIGMIINMLDAEVRGCKLVCLRVPANRYSLCWPQLCSNWTHTRCNSSSPVFLTSLLRRL